MLLFGAIGTAVAASAMSSGPPQAPAGSIASALTLRVTGNPAEAGFLREQAANAAQRAAQTRPNARAIAAAEKIDVFPSLAPDDVITLDVPVKVEGTGYRATDGTTHVRVENVALPSVQPRWLSVVQLPDVSRRAATLLTSDVPAGASVRFLAQATSPSRGGERRVLFNLANDSSLMSTVQLIEGAAGPEESAITAGHLAAGRFLLRLLQDEGIIIAVPPHAAVPLVQQTLSKGESSCALLQVRVLNGAALRGSLRFEGLSGREDAASEKATAVPFARYAPAEFRIERTYVTPGDDLVVPIGTVPLTDESGETALLGDYGVVQRITVRMVNNDSRPARVALSVRPRGGPAMASFVLDRG
ncbi:MAG: hypothetical protein JO060_04700, partial [Candidatus Eremiobacteraeota bacterium]|nr:hypothetical protein [Candidatus Eremiobacteraeota bacterium]